MILMLLTLSKVVEMGPELEALGAEVRALANKHGLELNIDFDKLEVE